MKRNIVLLMIGLILFISVSSLSFGAEHPNIVLILADDLGYGDIGVQNPESKIPTRNIDKLASEGVRFTDAHSSSGVCTPSRYALLHGRYHWRKFHQISWEFGESVLDKERPTIAQVLKTKGYQTACIGKWHLGWNWEAIKKTDAKPVQGQGYAPTDFDWNKPLPDGPLDHGFDYYFGDDVPNFPPYVWIENNRFVTAPTVSVKGYGGGPAVEHWDFSAVMPTLTDKAVKWIEKQSQDQPFFLYFPLTAPHVPVVPTKEFIGTSKAETYGDYVVQVDATVGRVLKTLESKGFSKNTLVIFSSDNGPDPRAYPRVKATGHWSANPLRGLKGDLWEGGHRVPFVVRWQEKIPTGQVNHGLISQIDLFSTIAEIVGYKIPDGVAEDSFNQLPFLLGTSPSVRKTLVHNTLPNQYALRHGNWVLIAAKSGTNKVVPEWFNELKGYTKNEFPGELYDLHEDISQKNSLYEKYPDKAAELTEILNSLRQTGQVRPFIPSQP